MCLTARENSQNGGVFLVFGFQLYISYTNIERIAPSNIMNLPTGLQFSWVSPNEISYSRLEFLVDVFEDISLV